MVSAMLYYLAWQEDDWLDEVLDRFRQVNALVPTSKSFQLMQTQHDQGEVKRAVVVVNAAHEKDKSKDFLKLMQTDQRLSSEPLYIVGVTEEEAAEWRILYPRANVIVISGYVFDFDFESVLDLMEADLMESQ